MNFISRATADRSKLITTLAYYAAFIALGFVTASLGPTLTGLAENTGTTLGQISILAPLSAFGYLCGSFFAGRVYDRVPGHPVMIVALLIMASMMALYPEIPLLPLLAICAFVLAAAQATLDVGGNTLLVWIHRDDVGPYMNGLHFFFGVGAFVSPVIIGQVIERTEAITWAYRILALLILPASLWLLRLPSPPIRNSAEEGAERENSPLLLGLVMLFLFLYVGMEASMSSWISPYTEVTGLADEARAAYLTSGFWGALTVGRLLAIPLAVRLSPQRVLLIDLVGVLASMGLFVLLPHSLVAVWVATVGAGLAMASIFPTTLSFAERKLTISGKVTSWFFVGASLGGMGLPWLVGRLFETLSPQALGWGVLVNAVVALGVYTLLARRP